MSEGQEVTVVADAYLEGEERGRVSTMAPATKADFAILPAQKREQPAQGRQFVPSPNVRFWGR